MNGYIAPTRDMRFVINELGLLPAIQKLRGWEDTNEELVDAVLEEAG